MGLECALFQVLQTRSSKLATQPPSRLCDTVRCVECDVWLYAGDTAGMPRH